MVDELSRQDGLADDEPASTDDEMTSSDARAQHRSTVAPRVAHVVDADPPAWSASSGNLHLASGADSEGVAARDQEVVGLLRSADGRDAAAGRRDVETRGLSPEHLALLSDVHMELAARDRDLAAGDRADLISLLGVPTNSGVPRPR